MTDIDRLAYSVDEAAAAVGLSSKTLRRAQADGELRFHFPTSKPVVLRADLEAWIQSAPTSRRTS